MQNLESKIKKINVSAKYMNVVAIGAFLLIVIFGYFASETLAGEVRKKKDAADAKKMELVTRAENVEKFKKLKSKVPDFAEKVEVLDNIKNDQQSIEQLISQVERIADASGVQIPSMLPAVNSQSSLQVSISFIGQYESIKKFFNGIENNQMIMNISDITISGPGPDLNVSLIINTGTGASVPQGVPSGS